MSNPPRMLFRGFALALLGSLCIAVPVASADRPHPDPDVAGLQTALKLKGFYEGRIDGLRGPLTRAALRALRAKYRLPTSNLVDRRTRIALGALGRHRFASRFLRRRNVGLDVAALQFELRYHGFPAPATGVFERHTKVALERFQRFAGLPGDGIAGRATYAALAKPPPAVPSLRPPLPLSQHAKHVGTAVEITCPYAAAVASSIAGRVVFAANRSHGYGYTVVIRDGRGLELLYAHLARIDVHRGDRLAAGAAVGLAGWTGKKRPEASLRVELRLRGARLDAYTALYGH